MGYNADNIETVNKLESDFKYGRLEANPEALLRLMVNYSSVLAYSSYDLVTQKLVPVANGTVPQVFRDYPLQQIFKNIMHVYSTGNVDSISADPYPKMVQSLKRIFRLESRLLEWFNLVEYNMLHQNIKEIFDIPNDELGILMQVKQYLHKDYLKGVNALSLKMEEYRKTDIIQKAYRLSPEDFKEQNAVTTALKNMENMVNKIKVQDHRDLEIAREDMEVITAHETLRQSGKPHRINLLTLDVVNRYLNPRDTEFKLITNYINVRDDLSDIERKTLLRIADMSRMELWYNIGIAHTQRNITMLNILNMYEEAYARNEYYSFKEIYEAREFMEINMNDKLSELMTLVYDAAINIKTNKSPSTYYNRVGDMNRLWKRCNTYPQNYSEYKLFGLIDRMVRFINSHADAISQELRYPPMQTIIKFTTPYDEFLTKYGYFVAGDDKPDTPKWNAYKVIIRNNLENVNLSRTEYILTLAIKEHIEKKEAYYNKVFRRD